MNTAHIKATGIPESLEQYQLALDCAVAAGQASVLAKLTAGVAVPDLRDFAISDRAHIELIAAFHQYGASQRLAGREQVLKEATDLDWTAIMCEGCLVTWENAETLGCHAVEHIRALAASPQEQA